MEEERTEGQTQMSHGLEICRARKGLGTESTTGQRREDTRRDLSSWGRLVSNEEESGGTGRGDRTR